MLKIGRRQFIQSLALSPALLAACGSAYSNESHADPSLSTAITDEMPATPAPTLPTPDIAQGFQLRQLLPGTPYETPLYIFGSGLPGKTVLALGGEEGNEPGGWLAGERLVDLFSSQVNPVAGAIIVLPRANRIASQMFQRTTAELGDLNRLYPGDPDGLPMARLASQIVAVLNEFQVNVLVDMHESWAFYRDRNQNGTAFLGQTLTASPGEQGEALGRAVVDAENVRVQSDEERFTYRTWGEPPDNPNLPSQAPVETYGARGTNSLNLPRYVPGLITLLVEMGQQQAIERRVAMHVEIVREVARQEGILS